MHGIFGVDGNLITTRRPSIHHAYNWQWYQKNRNTQTTAAMDWQTLTDILVDDRSQQDIVVNGRSQQDDHTHTHTIKLWAHTQLQGFVLCQALPSSQLAAARREALVATRCPAVRGPATLGRRRRLRRTVSCSCL